MRICALALVLAVAANAASLENGKSTNEATPQAANTKTEQNNHVETSKTTSTQTQVKPSEQTNNQHYEKADLLRARKKRGEIFLFANF